MTKKGKQIRKYTDEERRKIINEYLEGNCSMESLAKKYGIASRKTVFSWWKKYKELGTTDNQKKPGTKEKNIDYKVRYEILKNYRAFLKKKQAEK